MMKRLIALVLTVLMMVMMCACISEEPADEGVSNAPYVEYTFRSENILTSITISTAETWDLKIRRNMKWQQVMWPINLMHFIR